MMITNKSEVINKLFFKELQDLIHKYNNMDTRTIQTIESIYLDMKDSNLKEYLLSEKDKLEEVIQYYNTNEIDINEITFFACCNWHIEEMSIRACEAYYMDLWENGYTEVDEYLIYSNSKDLNDYTRDKLDDMLDSNYEIDRLFDKEQIIDFWLEGTSKDELIDEMIEDTEIEDILDIDPDYCFTFRDDKEYVYASI